MVFLYTLFCRQVLTRDRELYSVTNPTITAAPPDYNLGLRLGQASQIDSDLFIGREQELQSLWTRLKPGDSRNIVAVWGMGGVGKTQLCMSFIRSFGRQYSAVYWLDAKHEDLLKADLASLALEVSGTTSSVADTQDKEVLVQRARQWLSQGDNDQWLIVYDNYDDPRLPGLSSPTGYDIRAYFPHRAHGSILITTRSPELVFAKQIPLRKLEDEEESLSVLATRSKRDVTQDAFAVKLAQRLDGLPLALATAGAYLGQSTVSFKDYLQLYDDCWHDLSQDDGGPIDYEGRTLYTTWNMSFEQLQKRDPAAADLLRLMAYFDNQDLWYELFHAGHDLADAPTWWVEIQRSRVRFDRAISALQKYSLLEVSGQRYSLHPCLHDWTLEHLNRELAQERYRVALHCIAQSVKPNGGLDGARFWPRDRRVLPHARRVVLPKLQSVLLRTAIDPEDLSRLAYLYRWNDMYEAAEQMYTRAQAGYEQLFGSDHPSTLNTIHELGILYSNQGRPAAAEQAFLQALKGLEQVLGPRHTLTLKTIKSLGTIYLEQNKLAEAEQMCIRALNGYKQILDPDDASMLGMFGNLGRLYGRQGRVVEAEAILLRVSARQEQVLGPRHTRTLRTLNDLGRLYLDQRKLVEAEQIHLRVLAEYEQALGPNHTWTLATIHDLGRVYLYQVKMVAAEQMLLRALAGYKQALGSYHNSTLSVVNELGILYTRQGRLDQAEQMYLQVLAGQASGSNHVSTLTTVDNIAHLYVKQGRLIEAEQMFLRALAGWEQAVGPDRLRTLNTARQLIDLYRTRGKTTEAQQIHDQHLGSTSNS